MYQKITITVPQQTFHLLQQHIPKGKQSPFIAEAIFEKIAHQSIYQKKVVLHPVDEALAFSRQLPKRRVKQIIFAIEKGRL